MSVEPQATIWITGAAGRMGRTISARLDHNRYRVVTTDRELDIVAYRTKSVSHLGASAQVDAPFSFV